MILKKAVYLIAIYLIIMVFISASLAYELSIETKKGDVIKGNWGVEKLKVQPDFGGVIDITVREIIGLSGEENNYIFKMQDGSTLKGKVTDEKLLIKTKYGIITVPTAQIKKITLEEAKGSRETLAKEGKIDHRDYRRLEIKKRAGRGHNFEFSLESVEIKDGYIILNLGFKNISDQFRRIRLLKPDERTVLLDEDGFEKSLIRVEGLGEDYLIVNPSAKKIAIFTFQLPTNHKRCKFVCYLDEPLARHDQSYVISIEFEIPSK